MTTETDETPFDVYREDVDRPISRLFLSYAPGRLGWFSAGMVANFVARMASLVPPLLLGVAIDAIFTDADGAFELPLVSDAWLPAEPMAQFWFTIVAIAVSFVVVAVFTWIYGVTANLFAHSVMHTVRVECFEKMQRLDMAFFDDKQTGEVMAVLNNDTQNLELFLDNALMNSARLIVMVAGIAGVLFYLNWQLAFVTLFAVPAMVLFTLWFMRVVEPRYVRQRSAVGRLNTRLENAIARMGLTKTSSMQTVGTRPSGRHRQVTSSRCQSQRNSSSRVVCTDSSGVGVSGIESDRVGVNVLEWSPKRAKTVRSRVLSMATTETGVHRVPLPCQRLSLAASASHRAALVRSGAY
ncbi:ABC-type transport system permease protein (probable substrate iron) [Natrialba magadii ATCC 43099]|uniref:ABC transporter permease n=1 Tax=Natrialba magadii (strain ATCC 43099 / DSM 3394 / CCM 3739 / CIP 104546 / IAM 13178 / JCM 8861 / NBRC 102185 / NCIMB 2190 / MS3) TaxID=547559 RepID=D3STM2_NATMM|nr:ABC-type transport system permease protein (probable substrate iron) [Natrialba magadii ATCC 43099]ELY23413.1 ABC transporter permease [Natrialba magadii ATCC 43099]